MKQSRYSDRYGTGVGIGADYGYRDDCYDEEMYVCDQSCENCRYYCGWGEEGQKGCKFYTRDDYERFPKTHWCYQWKGIRKSHNGRHSGR